MSTKTVELRGSCDPHAFVPIAEDPESEELKRCRKYVACESERIFGFIGMDGDYLAWLYVDPEYYGRGVGRHLLQLAIRHIGPGAWTIVLEGNERARGLYESENAGYPCTCVRMALNHQ